MKGIIWIIAFVPQIVLAQNVGIGTTVPEAKLQINSLATFGSPTLKLFDSSVNSAPTIEFQNASGNNYWQMGGITHVSNPDLSAFHFYTKESPFLFSIIGNGNVGVGTSTPTVRLDVSDESGNVARFNSTSNNMYISFNENNIYRGYIGSYAAGQGIEDMDFGTGVGSVGKLHLSIAAAPKLTVSGNNVGIGTTSPAYRLDVNGDANLRSVLRLNGNAGVAGQVLQSNGSGAPTWENVAYGNTNRFSVSYGTTAAIGFMNITIPANYNLNATQTSIGTTGITVYKAGLYHLEGVVSHSATYATNQTVPMPKANFNLIIGGIRYSMLVDKGMPAIAGNNFRYANSEKFSIDIHLQAGTQIRLETYIIEEGSAFEFDTGGWLNGHLISE